MLFTLPPPARCPESQRRRWRAWVSGGYLVNIHSKVYVHMYTYVQTQPPAPGTAHRLGRGQTNGVPLSSVPCESL